MISWLARWQHRNFGTEWIDARTRYEAAVDPTYPFARHGAVEASIRDKYNRGRRRWSDFGFACPVFERNEAGKWRVTEEFAAELRTPDVATTAMSSGLAGMPIAGHA
jgi:hypothetical protein